jgi:uncharacterized membrane protein YkvA (DUF1232 family)
MSDLPPNEQENKQRNRQLSEYSDEERAGVLRTLANRAVLTWQLFWDGRVSFWPKLIPVAAVIYTLSPLDFIAEILAPALGPLVLVDDVGLLILALTLFIKLAPPDVVSEHLHALGARVPSPTDLDEDGDVIEGYAEVVDE